MDHFAQRTKSNIYGIKGRNNIFSWKGLGIHLKYRDRVGKCVRYDSCQSGRKSFQCMYSIKKHDAMYLLESEFSINADISEKIIYTLIEYGWAHVLRCSLQKGGEDVFSEDSVMLLFDEYL
ncbi:hypothetical protein Mzhil_0529 [Methanosalsum zhilinae DSM 4017]|uniref:Uncharacterized protein n=1 Tax=Methanosalsum zhilinae (strain DSM 4017 / NBRC 107636 / OCM 62 / WeN5) TaxID=679901 RepID=F7XQ38_METZD|nr:hypothetical protein [Methanosalsum zhilinae]AEH60399.1 hypothetical protein Mzhil_0529 [Methanosalsum zhilinae DSM 4017]